MPKPTNVVSIKVLMFAARTAGDPSVADLAAHHIEEHLAVRVKPKIAANARTAVRRHIVPTLGRLPLSAVKRTQILELQQKRSDSPPAANTAIKSLSHMYRLAAGWGMVPEGCNPCRNASANASGPMPGSSSQNQSITATGVRTDQTKESAPWKSAPC